MRKLFSSFFIVLIVPFCTQAKDSKCIINGTVSDSQSVRILIRNLTKPLADTIYVKNGKFKYTALLNEPLPFAILDEHGKYQLFFCEPNATINLTLATKEWAITFLEGSKSQELLRKLMNAQEPVQQLAGKVQQQLQQTTSNKDSLGAVMNQINSTLKSNFFNFLKDNGSTEVAAFAVYSSVTNDKNIKSSIADSMNSFLKEQALKSFYGVEVSKILNKMKSVEVGAIAPDFTLADSSGKKKYTLSKLRGNYALIDFWASWCGPCKGEIPFLKTAYAKYHAKGFEIMSVSLDSKKDAWMEALHKFEMPWIHVSDIKGFSSIVNDLYQIPSIPKTLLLDKEGKIIATDLRGQMLDKKLEELYGF